MGLTVSTKFPFSRTKPIKSTVASIATVSFVWINVLGNPEGR